MVQESKTKSTAQAIAGELAKAPSCHRIVFETGRMAPILFRGRGSIVRGTPKAEAGFLYRLGDSGKTSKNTGGEGGIRTHERLTTLPVFKTGAFNHSATSP